MILYYKYGLLCKYRETLALQQVRNLSENDEFNSDDKCWRFNRQVTVEIKSIIGEFGSKCKKAR